MTPQLGPISLERMFGAMEKVRQRLLRATGALERAGIPYAVVGGHAVAAWVSRVDEGAVRGTQDVYAAVGPTESFQEVLYRNSGVGQARLVTTALLPFEGRIVHEGFAFQDRDNAPGDAQSLGQRGGSDGLE